MNQEHPTEPVKVQKDVLKLSNPPLFNVNVTVSDRGPQRNTLFTSSAAVNERNADDGQQLGVSVFLPRLDRCFGSILRLIATRCNTEEPVGIK